MDVQRCDQPLSGGKTCCHVEGHKDFEDQQGKTIAHSHTWHHGAAGNVYTDQYIIGGETGEILGDNWTLDYPSYRSPKHGTVDDARRVLANQYGFNFDITAALPLERRPPSNFEWHYRGDTHYYGIDSNGYDVEWSETTGKVKRVYSINQKRQAARYAKRYGLANAVRKFNIPKQQIHSWMNGKGM